MPEVTEIPVCIPGQPVTGCCLVAIPNTSSWAVACPTTAGAPPALPSVSPGGLLVSAALLGAVGVALVRRWR